MLRLKHGRRWWCSNVNCCRLLAVIDLLPTTTTVHIAYCCVLCDQRLRQVVSANQCLNSVQTKNRCSVVSDILRCLSARVTQKPRWGIGDLASVLAGWLRSDAVVDGVVVTRRDRISHLYCLILPTWLCCRISVRRIDGWASVMRVAFVGKRKCYQMLYPWQRVSFIS